MSLTGKDAYTLMLKGYPDLLNIEDMCSILQISTKTGYRLLREGKINCIKIGRKYCIPKIHLLAYLQICSCAVQ